MADGTVSLSVKGAVATPSPIEVDPAVRVVHRFVTDPGERATVLAILGLG